MEKIVKLHIEGRHCGSCEKIIEMELAEVPGLKSSKISFQANEGEVVVEQGVGDQQIIEAIRRAGYVGKIIGVKNDELAADDNKNNKVTIETKIVTLLFLLS